MVAPSLVLVLITINPGDNQFTKKKKKKMAWGLTVLYNSSHEIGL